jgi:hypothetical protein
MEIMRRTTLALLRSEAYFLTVRQKIQFVRDAEAGGPYGGNCSPAFNLLVDQLLTRIAEANRLTTEERTQANEEGSRDAQQATEQLLAGKDLVK